MSEKHIECNFICTFAGQSMNANGTTTVKFVAGYDQLANVMQLCQFMSNDIDIYVTVPLQEEVGIAKYIRLQEIKISGDGSTLVSFKGATSFVDNDIISGLPNKQSDVQQFKVCIASDVEIEDEPVDTDDWGDDDDDDADWEE